MPVHHNCRCTLIYTLPNGDEVERECEFEELDLNALLSAYDDWAESHIPGYIGEHNPIREQLAEILHNA